MTIGLFLKEDPSYNFFIILSIVIQFCNLLKIPDPKSDRPLHRASNPRPRMTTGQLVCELNCYFSAKKMKKKIVEDNRSFIVHFYTECIMDLDLILVKVTYGD